MKSKYKYRKKYYIDNTKAMLELIDDLKAKVKAKEA